MTTRRDGVELIDPVPIRLETLFCADKRIGSPSGVPAAQSVAEVLFAEPVGTYFRDHYQWADDPSYIDSEASTYDPPCKPFREILEMELECDTPIVAALAECLPDESHRDIAQGAETFYDDFKNSS